MLTVINMSEKEQMVKLPVWTANVPMDGMMERLMKITEERYNVGCIQYGVKDGMLELRMDPMSCKVLRTVKQNCGSLKNVLKKDIAHLKKVCYKYLVGKTA